MHLSLPLVGVLVFVACRSPEGKDTAPPAVETGSLAIAPGTLDFGTLSLGGSITQTFSLTNTGEGTLRVFDVSFTDDALRVHWAMDTVRDVHLMAGDAVTVNVAFTPRLPGDADVDLLVTSDDPQRPEQYVKLLGTGHGTPDAHVTPTTVDFGTVSLGASTTAEISLANLGTADLEIRDASFADPEDPSFTLDIDPTGTRLAPGDQDGLALVRFTPVYDGTWYGSLVLTTNDPDEAETTVTLIGTGDAP